jgi:hypothetical protein
MESIYGATASSYDAYEQYRYRCSVTINGENCTSQYASPDGFQDDNPYAQFSIMAMLNSA